MEGSILKTGDILHCRNNRILGWIIRKFLKSPYSHTALFVIVENQRFIIDAQKDGVNLRQFDQWMKIYKYKFVVSRKTCVSGPKIISRAFSKIGVTGYDYESLIIKSPFEKLLNFWPKEKNPTKKMYCSEFVAWVFEIPNFYRMDPKELFEYCQRSTFINFKP